MENETVKTRVLSEVRKLAATHGYYPVISAFITFTEEHAHKLKDEWDDPTQAAVMQGNANHLRELLDPRLPSKATSVYSREQGQRILVRGDNHGRTTLTSARVVKLREEIKSAVDRAPDRTTLERSIKAIAKHFKITTAYLRQVASGKYRAEAGGPVSNYNFRTIGKKTSGPSSKKKKTPKKIPEKKKEVKIQPVKKPMSEVTRRRLSEAMKRSYAERIATNAQAATT